MGPDGHVNRTGIPRTYLPHDFPTRAITSAYSEK